MKFTKVEGSAVCYMSRFAIVDDEDNVVSCATDETEAALIIDAYEKRSEQEPDWRPESLEISNSEEEEDMTITEEFGGKPNPGTKPDKRLRENNGCPPGQHKNGAGRCVPDGADAEVETFHPGHGDQSVHGGGKRKKAGGATKRSRDRDSATGRERDLYRRTRGRRLVPVTSDGDTEFFEDEIDDAIQAIELDQLDGPLIQWEGVLAVEGIETGDGREFVPNSLEWPDLDEVIVPLMWQRQSEPQHNRSEMVGRIQEVWRDGDEIWGRGVIKSDADVVEEMRHGLAGGVSVDVDSVKGHDVELIYPDAGEDEVVRNDDENNITMLFGPPPDKVRFHRGRLRGATLVALPAFVQARINLVEPEAELVASAAVPIDPPAEWFTNPGLMAPTPWTVTDDGRVLGHMALWSTCHQTFPDRCITPPREPDYPYFMRRELKTAEGNIIGVGPITMGTGHAKTNLGARPAAQHYDDTGSVVCDVTVGADRFGIWVSGALRPDVDAIKLRALRGAALSGDWRRIGGQLRLVAVLAVNVPGFPIPRMAAYTSNTQETALVAAGVVTEDRVTNVRQVMAQMDEDATIRVRKVTLTKG